MKEQTKRRGEADVLNRGARAEGADRGEAISLTISVVIAWVNDLDLLIPGLESLSQQHGRGPDEVVVVTRRSEAEREHLAHLYPTITVLGASSETPVTVLRSMGIQYARGDAVVVTEDHCVPCREWIAVIEQHMRQEDCVVVGGPVENAATQRLRDWAAFLTEYCNAVLPASRASGNQQVPGNNVAYRRELLADLCTTLDRGRWESFYHEKLIKRGVDLVFDPRMLVYHRRPFGFRYFVTQRYHFCRSFAAMRSQSFTTADRLKYGAGSVLLPSLLLFRGLRTITRKRRLVDRYVWCLPLIATYFTVGAFAEMMGYLLGDGGSLVRVE